MEIRVRICKPFKEHRNRFPAWRAGATTLFDVTACQATVHKLSESIPGLLKRLQIRALDLSPEAKVLKLDGCD
jgi:hypothetical protein